MTTWVAQQHILRYKLCTWPSSLLHNYHHLHSSNHLRKRLTMVKGSDVLLIIVRTPETVDKCYSPIWCLWYSTQVAILFPPAAAAFITGCSCDLLINILLTMYVHHFVSFPYLPISSSGTRRSLTTNGWWWFSFSQPWLYSRTLGSFLL